MRTREDLTYREGEEAVSMSYPKLFECDCGATIEITAPKYEERITRDQCPFCGVVGSFRNKR